MIKTLLQIEAPITITSLLVAGITALATVVVFQFNYIRVLHKELTKQSEQYTTKFQEVYKDQIKDNKDIITNNTRAITEHTQAVQESAEAAKDLKDAFSEMRLWLKENYEKPHRT